MESHCLVFLWGKLINYYHTLIGENGKVSDDICCFLCNPTRNGEKKNTYAKDIHFSIW